MFRITSEQIDELAVLRIDVFVRETVQHLRTRFPQETMLRDEVDLDALVRRARKRGTGWGIASAYDIERLSECLLLYGADFGDSTETGWAGDILSRDDLAGREKMNAISRYETFSLRSGQ